MFGPKIRTVFRSRWNALFWSASVLLTAYCSVPSPHTSGTGKADTPASGNAVSQAQAREVARAVQGTSFDAGPQSSGSTASDPDKGNPWGYTKPKAPVRIEGE